MKNLTHLLLLLISGGLCAPVFAQDAPQPARSAVRGRVVYADTRQPVRRAEVVLASPVADSFSRRTVTADDGAFALENVGGGDYFLYATVPGLVRAAKPAPAEKQESATPPTENAKNLNLASYVESNIASHTVTLDGTNQLEMTLTLVRGGTLSGLVKYQDGEPVVGAKLMLYAKFEGKLTRFYLPEEAATDDRGRYAVTGLATGDYLVALVQPREAGPDFAPHDEDVLPRSSIFLATYPAADTLDGATATVRVEAGSVIDNADLTVNADARRRIAGRVIWRESGTPAEAAIGLQFITPLVEPTSAQNYFSASSNVFAVDSPSQRLRTGVIRTRTDKEGRWAAEDLRPGRYRVSVLGVDEKEPTDRTGQPEDFTLATDYQEIDVRDADAENITTELTPGPSISGTARTADGKPFNITQLQLMLEPLDDAATMTLFDSYLPFYRAWPTDDQGNFIFKALRPGRFTLRLFRNNDGPYLRNATLNGVDILHQPLTLSAGQSLTGMQLVFDDKFGTVRGRLRTPDGRPVPKLTIAAWPVAASNPLPYFTRSYDPDRRTEADGTFEFDLPPGEYFVAPALSDIGADNLAELLAQLQTVARRVTIRANQTANVELVTKPPANK